MPPQRGRVMPPAAGPRPTSSDPRHRDGGSQSSKVATADSADPGKPTGPGRVSTGRPVEARLAGPRVSGAGLDVGAHAPCGVPRCSHEHGRTRPQGRKAGSTTRPARRRGGQRDAQPSPLPRPPASASAQGHVEDERQGLLQTRLLPERQNYEKRSRLREA